MRNISPELRNVTYFDDECIDNSSDKLYVSSGELILKIGCLYLHRFMHVYYKSYQNILLISQNKTNLIYPEASETLLQLFST